MITFDRKKDKVAIIAPSSACRDKEGNFDHEISRSNLEVAISLFEEHGFSCKYDEKIFTGGSLEYFAASKEERLKQLIEAIEDPRARGNRSYDNQQQMGKWVIFTIKNHKF